MWTVVLGHKDVVRFLVEACRVNPMPKDRWVYCTVHLNQQLNSDNHSTGGVQSSPLSGYVCISFNSPISMNSQPIKGRGSSLRIPVFCRIGKVKLSVKSLVEEHQRVFVYLLHFTQFLPSSFFSQ